MLYRDDNIEKAAIISRVLQSETGMVVLRLRGLEDSPDGLQACVRWKSLGSDENTLQILVQAARAVSQLFGKLLKRRSAPKNLVDRARVYLHSQREECSAMRCPTDCNKMLAVHLRLCAFAFTVLQFCCSSLQWVALRIGAAQSPGSLEYGLSPSGAYSPADSRTNKRGV